MSSRAHKLLPKQRSKASSTYLGKIIFGVAIIEPLMTIPQIYKIWSTKEAKGVSLITWMFYTLASIVWLVYGFRIKDKPVIIASALWIMTEGLVVLGVLLYMN